ncbi:MAG: nucleotidyltransferase family protein [Candidatus Omnitrophota bacterium]|nr:nucleotidyltransferase family protein [Candidatus Omnitrophota bacterium]
MLSVNTGKTDVVILCGGFGKRLRSVVGDRPKSMAEIGERPFLDLLIERTVSFGFKRFILCAGYRSDVLEKYYRQKRDNTEILISKEEAPLGTGGAVKNAENIIRSSPFLVMNGDSLCRVKMDEFIGFHERKKALISIVLVNSVMTEDYGSVKCGAAGRIAGFDEKAGSGNKGLINAGIYLFDKAVLDLMPGNRAFSLEYDFFPKMTEREIYGYATDGDFIDIGTPERLAKAKEILRNQREAYGG